jgi:predicted PurR-regulated permease PerM
LLLLIGLITLGGFAIVDQTQSLINLLDTALKSLPGTLENLSTQVIRLGPFVLDMTKLDIQTVTNQVLSTVQPLLGEVGTLVGKVATSAAGFLGWLAFVLIISYFISAESGGRSSGLVRIDIPGYAQDIRRMGKELDRVWSAFLVGQLILVILTILIYFVLLSILGVRFALGLALLAGLARFLPYVGPGILWITLSLVTFFQGSTLFNLTPLVYLLIVVGLSMIVDTVFDNFVSPKVMGTSLRLHPAAVLVSALIAANLIGIIGVLLAAPVLASLNLMGRYLVRKLFDQDPWENWPTIVPPTLHIIIPAGIRQRADLIWKRLRRKDSSPDRSVR